MVLSEWESYTSSSGSFRKYFKQLKVHHYRHIKAEWMPILAPLSSDYQLYSNIVVACENPIIMPDEMKERNGQSVQCNTKFRGGHQPGGIKASRSRRNQQCRQPRHF